MVADRLDDVRAAVDQVDDAGRQVALLEQLEHALLRERHLLGRLERRTCCRETTANGRNQSGTIAGKLNGAMAAHDADRLADHLAVDVRRDVLEAVAHQQRRRAAGHLDALDAAADAAARLVERLAVLGRDDAGELLEVLFEQLPELEHRRGRGRRAASRSTPGKPSWRPRRRRRRPQPVESGVFAITSPRAGLWTSRSRESETRPSVRR